MPTLYDYAFSGNGYRVRLALAELEIPYQHRELDIVRGETSEPWFLAKNPMGQIPVLELDDGTCLSESTAILFFLARGTHLMPDSALAQTRILQWMSFEQTNVDGVISRARFRRTFPDVIPTRPEEFEPWMRDGGRALDVLEAHLSGRRFLVDDSYSIADMALYSYTHRAYEGGFDLEKLPAMKAWFKRIEERPKYVPML